MVMARNYLHDISIGIEGVWNGELPIYEHEVVD